MVLLVPDFRLYAFCICILWKSKYFKKALIFYVKIKWHLLTFVLQLEAYLFCREFEVELLVPDFIIWPLASLWNQSTSKYLKKLISLEYPKFVLKIVRENMDQLGTKKVHYLPIFVLKIVFWIFSFHYLRSSAWKCCGENSWCCCHFCCCNCCCRCCFGSCHWWWWWFCCWWWWWWRICGSFMSLLFKYLSVPWMKNLKTELRSTFYRIFRTKQYQKRHNTSLFKSSHGLTLLNGCTWMNQNWSTSNSSRVVSSSRFWQ